MHDLFPMIVTASTAALTAAAALSIGRLPLDRDAQRPQERNETEGGDRQRDPDTRP